MTVQRSTLGFLRGWGQVTGRMIAEAVSLLRELHDLHSATSCCPSRVPPLLMAVGWSAVNPRGPFGLPQSNALPQLAQVPPFDFVRRNSASR